MNWHKILACGNVSKKAIRGEKLMLIDYYYNIDLNLINKIDAATQGIGKL